MPIPDGESEGSTTQVACLAIFDGHGGPNASSFVKDTFFGNLLNHANFRSHPFKAMCDAYEETDQAYLEKDAIAHNDDGCTATTAILVGRRLVTGHIGDSRAVIGEGGTATPLTDDHKPNRPDERSRIETVGGTVIHAGTWRVGGVLAVSRSFGDRQLKQWVVSHPEIREDLMHSTTSCLIVASDGIWDVVDNQEAINIVAQHEDAESAAKALATVAYEQGSYDNISCVVCLFELDEKEDTHPAPPIPADGMAPEKKPVARLDVAMSKMLELGAVEEEKEEDVATV
jgi:protein phosphatase 1L